MILLILGLSGLKMGKKAKKGLIKTIVEMDYFIDGTKMDKKRLKELTRMG